MAARFVALRGSVGTSGLRDALRPLPIPTRGTEAGRLCHLVLGVSTRYPLLDTRYFDQQSPHPFDPVVAIP